MSKCYSLNAERWYTDFEAVLDALGGNAKKDVIGKTYYEGDQKIIKFSDCVCFKSIAEYISEQVYEEVGDVAEMDALNDVEFSEFKKLLTDFFEPKMPFVFEAENIIKKKITAESLK